MRELVRLSVFLVFLGLGLRVVVAGPQVRRKWVNMLLVYVLCVSGAAGFTQRDIWPFSAYRIFYHYKPAGHVAERLTLRLVDPGGRECEADPRFASPVVLTTLQAWFERSYPRLTEPQQQRAMRFLLARAREAADRAVLHQDPTIVRVLASLAAPAHWALYAMPSSGDFLRCVPYAGLRVYRDVWRPSETFLDARRVARQLLWEYRSP